MSRSFLVSFLALTLSTSLGCGSSSDDQPANTTTDTGTPTTDSNVATDSGSGKDTGTPADTGSMGGDGGLICVADLPASFTCDAWSAPAGSTSCSESDLEDYVATCIQADTTAAPSSACTAWKAAHGACTTCLEAWSYDMNKIYPDDWLCDEAIVPGCGKARNCEYSCLQDVCGDCDPSSPAPGDAGASGLSELGYCNEMQSADGGKCWTVASKQAADCVMKPELAPCNITQYYSNTTDLTKLKSEVLRVLRGACRDNKDWTNSSSAGGDAGTDSGSDSGATDGGAADSGATDGAATDAAAG